MSQEVYPKLSVRTVNLLGQQFGRLSIVAFHAYIHQAAHWKALCDCGTFITCSASMLRSGHTKSCGCLRREIVSKLSTARGAARILVPGKPKMPEYAVWRAMVRRCHNPHDAAFKNYGARGILVCEAWRHNYLAFLADMGERHSAAYSIERVNNDGNYCPENCIWATSKAQAQNTRHNRFITYEGVTLTIGEWARRLDTSDGTIRYRLRQGWSLEKALTTPIQYKKTP